MQLTFASLQPMILVGFHDSRVDASVYIVLVARSLATKIEGISHLHISRLLVDAAGVKVSDLYRRFVGLVLRHKRENCLPLITYIYIHLYRREKKITRVVFSSAVPVNEATQRHLVERLTQETGNTIEFTGEIKPELIGGFRLQMGNYRLDASYASQLRDIRERLLENK